MNLEVDDIHAGYTRDIDILQGVSVQARNGQLTTIIGANGVGKSTLLKAIIGQLRPHAGRIRYNDTDLTRVATRELVRFGIAYIAQRHAIFPQMTVLENLEMGTWSFHHDRQRRQRAVQACMERAPYLQEFRNRKAGLLSGGQQRLMEIERALMTDPELILIDEPTVGLDPKRADAVYARLRELVSETGKTILMVDQNILAGIDAADYVYVLELGKNKLEGTRVEFDTKYRARMADWLL